MKHKIVLVGCGYWGKNWYNTLTKLPGVEIIAVIDPAPSIPVSNQVASLEQFDQRSYDYTHAIVAVQAEHHSVYVNYFRQKIVAENILVEKPCGLLTEPQDQYNGCFPGYLFLSTPHYKKIKKLVQESQLGEILYSQFRRASMGPRIRTDVSIIEDYMIHDLYMYLDLFNPNQATLTIDKNAVNVFGDPIKSDTLSLNISNRSHTASFFSSWVYPQKERKIVIIGDRGSLVWEGDKLYHIKSYYKKINGKDSYGNVGWELVENGAEDITPQAVASTLELQFSDFVNKQPRLEVQKSLNKLLKRLVD